MLAVISESRTDVRRIARWELAATVLWPLTVAIAVYRSFERS